MYIHECHYQFIAASQIKGNKYFTSFSNTKYLAYDACNSGNSSNTLGSRIQEIKLEIGCAHPFALFYKKFTV